MIRPALRLSTLALIGVVACAGAQDADPGQPIVIEEPREEPPSEPASDPEHDEDERPLVVSDDACETDDDCVPGGCCHADACVAETNAPSCADAMCTQECRYGTLDCGGGCLCHEGRCAARLSVAPQMLPRE